MSEKLPHPYETPGPESPVDVLLIVAVTVVSTLAIFLAAFLLL